MTNQQDKEILEWCGFSIQVEDGVAGYEHKYWVSSDKEYHSKQQPPIDLNFFGKWVMVNPGIRGYSIAKLHRYDNRILKMAIIETTKLFEYKIYSNFDHKAKDEGLTLDDVDALKSALVKLVSEHSTITLRK